MIADDDKNDLPSTPQKGTPNAVCSYASLSTYIVNHYSSPPKQRNLEVEKDLPTD